MIASPWASFGTGTQGRGLLNNFLAMPDTQVVAVCDVDTTRRDHHRKLVDEFYSAKGNKEYQGCNRLQGVPGSVGAQGYRRRGDCRA